MSKLSRKTVSVAVAVATVIWLSGVAPMPIASAQTAAELQVLINSLLVQIQALQAQLTTQLGQQPASTYNFTRNLTVGSRGDDVTALQQALIASGNLKITAPTGYFGPLTQAALAAWQAANGVSPASGFFGPITRAAFVAKGVAVTTITPTVPTTILPATSYLKVETAGPAGTTLPDGSLYNQVLRLKFSAGNQNENVTGVTVSRGGFIANTNITGVSLWDDSNNRYGNIISALTADGKATISFSGNPFIVLAGQTRYLNVDINIGDANSGSVSFSVNSVTDITVASGSSQLQGPFPLSGSLFTIVDGSTSIANLRVNYQSVAGLASTSIATVTGNVDIGDIDKEVFKLNLYQVNSLEAIQIEKIIFYVEGTIQEAKDVTNWRLYSPEGNLLASTSLPIDRYVTLNLATPYVVDKGLSKNLTVKANISDGSGNYFRVYIQNDYDILAKGVITGAYVQPTDSNGLTLTASDTQNGISGFFKMRAGSLTVSKAVGSPSGNVAPSSQNVVLAKYDLKSSGENLEVRQIGVQVNYAAVTLTGTLLVRDATTGETYLSIAANTTGLTTTSVISATTLLDNIRNLSSYIMIPSGQTKSIEIVGTVASTATSTSYYQVSVGQFYVKRYSTNDFTYLAAAAYDSNQLGVSDVALTVAKNQSFANTNRAAGTTNVKIAEFVLQASSADDIKVNSINFSIASSSFIQNMKLMDGTIQLGSTIGTPQSSGNSFTTNLTINKSQTKVLSVNADILSNATPDQVVIVSIAAAGVSGYGLVSSKSLENTPDVILAGQTITIKVGALIIARDASAPTTKIVLAGTTGVELNKIKFTASNEDLSLRKITLTLNSASTTLWGNSTGFAQNFSTVYLYDSTSLIGSGAMVEGDVVIDGINVTLPQDADKVLTVKADISGSGTFYPKSVGAIQVKSSTTPYMEVYAAQGSMSTGITLTSNAVSNNFIFHASAPTFAAATYTKGSGSGAEVGRFTITNNGTRAITLASTTVKASLSGGGASSTVGTFELYDSTNLTTAIDTDAAALTGASTSTNITFTSFTTTQEIAAGSSRTYVVKANVSLIEEGVSTPGTNTALLELEIIGSTGYSDTAGASELYWNDGNIVYSYTVYNPDSNTYSALNACDTGTVKFGTNTY